MKFQNVGLVLSYGLCALSFVGCLQTRSDVKTGEQRQVLQQQVGTLQKSNADTFSRISDLEEQMRFLNGRTEVVENKLASNASEIDQLRRGSNEANQAQNQKLQIYQEALNKMEQNINQLQADLGGLRAQQMAVQTKEAVKKESTKSSSQNSYDLGEEHFSKKEYKTAILEFEKYREKSPKGKYFGSATYKIGVSFQNLGMKDDAKGFYDEVISKYPKSEEARKAKARLQKIK